MLELWIPITVAAALLQNVRSALQKSLTSRLSTGGASWCRFVYGLPFALIYYLTLDALVAMPKWTLTFMVYAMVGGLAQIVGTFALVAAFAHRSFAVSVAWSKTETVQTALFGIVLLGEAISVQAAAGILISLIGVLWFSFRGIPAGGLMPTAGVGWGVLSGAGFAVAAVCYRGASVALPSGDFIARSATTLVWVLAFQSVAMGLWLAVREPGEVRRVGQAAPVAVWVGLTGMLASAAWFAAMTLENAAHVRALGQVELLFSFMISALWFREGHSLAEAVGMGLMCVGIVVLVL